MISIPAGARVLLATRPVDFRKGAHGLAALAHALIDAHEVGSFSVRLVCRFSAPA